MILALLPDNIGYAPERWTIHVHFDNEVIRDARAIRQSNSFHHNIEQIEPQSRFSDAEIS